MHIYTYIRKILGGRVSTYIINYIYRLRYYFAISGLFNCCFKQYFHQKYMNGN